MDIRHKNPKEIQQAIFDEIARGANREQLKQELSGKGVPVEAYYFTTEAERNEQIITPADDTQSGVSGWQVLIALLAVAFFVFRIWLRTSR